MGRMRSRCPGARALALVPALVPVLVLALALSGCAQEGLTAAERDRATTLPTPTAPGTDVQQVLDDRVASLLTSPVVTADEDLVVDETETATRLGWKTQGTVLDASMLMIGAAGAGTEVFRSPSTFLSRPTGEGAACWSPAGLSLARYDRPIAQEIALLRSARAIAGDARLVKGSVSALSALRIVGTDDWLRSHALLPPPGVRVAATFATGQQGLVITIAWSALVAAAGNSSRHTRLGTWVLRFVPTTSGGPTAPPSAQVVAVPATDPSFASALRACNAGIR